MAFCEECGTQLPTPNSVCPACGNAPASAQRNPYPPPQQTRYQQTEYRAPYPSQSKPSQVNENIAMAENERLVRKYMCSSLKRPRCEGYLTVTNKRVIFHAKGTSSRVSKEIILDSVSGLDCFYGMDIRLGGIIFGALLALTGIFGLKYYTLPSLVILVLGVLLILASIKRCFILSIFSSKATGAPISFGTGPRSMIGNGALYSLTCSPTHDTDRMINELGALVQDLQTLGDHAIEKWSR